MTQSSTKRPGVALPLPQRAQVNVVFVACVVGVALAATVLLVVALAELAPPQTDLHVPIWLITLGHKWLVR